VEGEERKEKAKRTVASEMWMRIWKKIWWEETKAWSRERERVRKIQTNCKDPAG
jgi:hypothetical protein